MFPEYFQNKQCKCALFTDIPSPGMLSLNARDFHGHLSLPLLAHESHTQIIF